MIKDKTVIVEYRLQVRKDKFVWCAVEVPYAWEGERLAVGAPHLISLPEGPAREDAELLFCAMVARKGDFFDQVAKAVRRAKPKKDAT